METARERMGGGGGGEGDTVDGNDKGGWGRGGGRRERLKN